MGLKKKKKPTYSPLSCIIGVMLQLSLMGSKTETADGSALSLLRAESSDYQSLLFTLSLQRSLEHQAGEGADRAGYGSQLQRGRANCQSGSWEGPENMVGILS